MPTTDAVARDWFWSQLHTIGELAADLAPALVIGAILALLCAAGVALGWGMARSGLR